MEKRAKEAQLRADQQLQLAMNRDDRSQQSLEMSQQRFDLTMQKLQQSINKNNSPSSSTGKILTSTQMARLQAAGIPQARAYDITTAILSGASLESIRQALKQDGLNPQLLDTYDRVVGIKSLYQTQEYKSGSTTGRQG